MESNMQIDRLRDEVVRVCVPKQIIVFSQKQKPTGDLYAVKLCVIIGEGDARKVEHRLYVEIESELPFDILVYTQEEWTRLLKKEMSFAAHIKRTGRVIYAAD